MNTICIVKSVRVSVGQGIASWIIRKLSYI